MTVILSANVNRRHMTKGQRAVVDPKITEAMIEAAMAKADTRVCFGNDRCYAFRYRVEDALPMCTSKGGYNVGWVVRGGGREAGLDDSVSVFRLH